MSEYAEFIAEVLGTEANPLHSVLTKAIDVIESTLRLYRDEEVAVSFNGGKDATITLHLLRYVLYKQERLHLLGTSIRIIYFEEDNSFPEIIDFVQETQTRYDLRYTTYTAPFKMGMSDAVKSGCRAIFMGMRVGDPYTEQAEHFSPSTSNFPPFMRVYPIFLWSFEHVWHFLRGAHIPYCSLYDHGYTSIGITTNTIPNPALLVNDSYQAAYMLKNEQLERICRVSSNAATPTASVVNEAEPKRHRSNSNSYISAKPISTLVLLTSSDTATIPTCDALNGLVTLQHIFGENILSTTTVIRRTSIKNINIEPGTVIITDTTISDSVRIVYHSMTSCCDDRVVIDVTEEKHLTVLSLSTKMSDIHCVVSASIAGVRNFECWIEEENATAAVTSICNGVK